LQAGDGLNTGAQANSSARDDKPAYSLPPDTLARAVAYSRIRVILDFASSGWEILQLLLLLQFGVIAWMGRVALAAGRNRWAQGFVFALLLLTATTLLDLPLGLYGHHAALAFGQSVQG